MEFAFYVGPNPIYTPILLDMLKKHDIKTIFFVVGSKAEKYQEVIARMHAEGQLIGLHNYVHKSNWVMPPWTIHRHISKSAFIIENITGERPVYYRPPWGLLNLMDFLLLKKYKVIHWSVMVEDGRVRAAVKK